MHWNFLGFHNWPAAHGVLTLEQSFDVFRASASAQLPRSVCEGCICWRLIGSCRQVQVDDHEEDRTHRETYAADKLPSGCLCFINCCPILFFDFIGIALPSLNPEEEYS